VFTINNTAKLPFYTNSTANGTIGIDSRIIVVTFRAPVSRSELEEGFHFSFGIEPSKSTTTNEFEGYRFTHFHFMDPNKTNNYTRLTGRKEYLPEEIVTMVISTEFNHSYAVNIGSLDIQSSTNCQADSLTRFRLLSSREVYRRIGNSQTCYR